MKNQPKSTISAGGIVRTVIKGKVHIVLIRDSEKHSWVLPKGHLEKGETIEQAGLREVREETGLKEIKIIQKLGIKKRLSFIGDEFKTIHYFLFDYLGPNKEKLEKTQDGGIIFTPRWFALDNLPPLFWPEQKDLIQESLNTIQGYVVKKIWPQYFDLVKLGKKKFEVRLADFNIQTNDVLILKEWDPKEKKYTGRKIQKKVDYVFKFKLGDFGQKKEIEKKGLYIIQMKD